MRHAHRLYLPLLDYAMNKETGGATHRGGSPGRIALFGDPAGYGIHPIMDEGAFDMDVSMLPGVSLAKAMEVNQQPLTTKAVSRNWVPSWDGSARPGSPWTRAVRTRPATWGYSGRER